MAGVSGLPGLWEQVRLIAGLRWTMQKNALRRREGLLDLLGLIGGIFSAALFTLTIAAGLGLASYGMLSRGTAEQTALLFWGIFLFWQSSPVLLSGVARRFEFKTLLRFPIRLGTFYFLSLAYGMADYASASGMIWTAAVVAGATLAQPEMRGPFLLAGALFVAVNVPLERFTGTLLEKLLSRRRTRELLFAVFLLLMFGLQFLAPMIGEHGKESLRWLHGLRAMGGLFPPELAGGAIAAAAEGQTRSLLGNAAGLAAFLLLAGTLLWKQLARQYRAEDAGETPAIGTFARERKTKQEEKKSSASGWLSPVIEGLAWKEIRYLLRNSFLLLQLAIPPLFVLLATRPFAHLRRNGGSPIFETLSRQAIFPAAAAYLLLILMAPAYNCLAYEGRGIQTYFAAPVRFRDVLAAKNLVQSLVIAMELAVSIPLLGMTLGFPAPNILAATLGAVVFSAACQFIAANWSSLLFPRRLEFGALRNQRGSSLAVLAMFAVQILLIGACGLVFAAGKWLGEPWLPAGVFAVLAGAALAGYSASLDGFSGLAERRKDEIMETLCR